MHMDTDRLDDVGDVRAGERQVMEGPIEAPEPSQSSKRRSGSGGYLGLHVHRHRDRLLVHHASTLKDVDSELALSEEEYIGLMLYSDHPKNGEECRDLSWRILD
jgi:hypothetical protein